MAGRGRGWAGRSTTSFNTEQLGVSKGDLSFVHQPPPKFPPLEYKPLPFTMTKELNYMMELKRDFVEYMRESKYNVAPLVVKKDIERYSDRYQYLDGSDKKNYETMYNWNRLPHELKPTVSKRKGKLSNTEKKKKKVKLNDISEDKKFEELEKKEIDQGSDAEDDKDDDDNDDEKDMNKQLDGDEDEVDDEMDEGTDYVNSYFDNGEGYDDEDDNMDDGPIY